MIVIGGCAGAQVPPIADTEQRLPGKFVWFDLATDDVDAAKRFYGAVFGWSFRELGGWTDRYTLIRQGNRDIGGVFAVSKDDVPRHARWVSLVSVEDAARAIGVIQKSGGQVLFGPKHLARRGTHALVRDAEGALFAVLQTESGDPPDIPVAVGDFFWVDLFAKDPAKTAEFYRAVAGYEVTQESLGNGIERLVLASGGFARAGISPLPAGVTEPGWLPYVLVDDVPGILRRARDAGGTVLVEPSTELLDGRLAVLADPSGAVLGIVDWPEEPAVGGAR
jgi:predicted enzyme related to lactoylglutathione lyase